MNIKTALALLTTFGFFFCVGLLAYVPIPPGNRDVLNIMIGTAGGGWMMVLGWYYGSSSGSELKTRLMAQAQADAANREQETNNVNTNGG